MNSYILINDFQKRGSLAISNVTFEKIVTNALSNVDGFCLSKDKMEKECRATLHSPVRVSITRSEIVHIGIYLDVRKGESIQGIAKDISNQVNEGFIYAIDMVPFDIQIKVVRLI